MVHRLASDWRTAELSPQNRALCTFAEKLTLSPKVMVEKDIQLLRECGFSDAAIHDATQVIAYFNYINRIADALGVDFEPDIPAWEKGTPRDLKKL